jgi:proteasome assembly chaperone (PAC2) family protein
MADILHRTQDLPELRNPSVVVGLSGWSNAAEVATGALHYLRDNLRARKFADIDGEEFYQFTTSRPTVAIDSGKIRTLTYPTTDFYAWTNPDGPQDLLLVIGTEPDLRWKAYMSTLIDLAQEVGASRICTVGGYFDSVPHTALSVCAGTSMDQAISDEMKQLEVQPSTYFGPTSILTSIVWEAHQRGIPAVSLWGRAPHYIQIPNPRVMHEVLWRVLALCKVRRDLGSLRKRGDELVQRITDALPENPQLREYVAQLEAGQETPTDAEPLRQEDVLKSVEDFFRDPPTSGRP